MKEIIPKSYQGTKPDIIAGVTDKPTERSERLWRSKKSPPHPETVARRDQEQASDTGLLHLDRLRVQHQPRGRR